MLNNSGHVYYSMCVDCVLHSLDEFWPGHIICTDLTPNLLCTRKGRFTIHQFHKCTNPMLEGGGQRVSFSKWQKKVCFWPALSQSAQRRDTLCIRHWKQTMHAQSRHWSRSCWQNPCTTPMTFLGLLNLKYSFVLNVNVFRHRHYHTNRSNLWLWPNSSFSLSLSHCHSSAQPLWVVRVFFCFSSYVQTILILKAEYL